MLDTLLKFESVASMAESLTLENDAHKVSSLEWGWYDREDSMGRGISAPEGICHDGSTYHPS